MQSVNSKSNITPHSWLTIFTILHSIRTFFENIFCRANPSVAASALIRPMKSKESSVTEAMTTPPTIGSSEQYTWTTYITTIKKINYNTYRHTISHLLFNQPIYYPYQKVSKKIWGAGTDIQFLQHVAMLAIQTAVIARAILSICLLFVCPSHSGVLSRWMKIWSCSFQFQVGQSF